MKIYNSISKKKEVFIPVSEDTVNIYTCGPTVYNYAHIGNFFSYLSADVLYRWLRYGKQYTVHWVMNITDVDDKTIRDSKKSHPKMPPKEALKTLCNFYETELFKDLELLNIPKDSFFAIPRATEYIKKEQELVQKIYDNGYAYISDGSVYFDINTYKKDHTYGKLIHIDEGFQSGVRVDMDEYEKANASDFVLWKGKKEGEPYWEFTLNTKDSTATIPGRPGWHLECSAMEEDLFDLPFDIHTGGIDLKFPHHENEIAQSLAGFKQDPTNYWFHNGHLLVEGEKMAKSKNNFYTLSGFLKEYNVKPEIFRLVMIINHYRSNFNITENGVHSAIKNLQEIRDVYKLFLGLKKDLKKEQKNSFILSNITKAKNDFFSAMNDDLNTPLAYSVFFQSVKKIRKSIIDETEVREEDFESIQTFFTLISAVLGVDFMYQDIIPKKIIDLAEKRVKVREMKDFKASDEIRDQIKELGYLIKDTSGSYEITKIE